MDGPPPPIFARGAGSGVNVLRETLFRQQAMRNAIDLNAFPDADDEDDGTDGRVGNVHRSPVLARKSPGMRSSAAAGRSRANGVEPCATQILDFLFLGSVQDAKNVEFLRRNNITTILNISQEEYYSPDPDRAVVRWFRAEDTCNFNIQQYFDVTEAILSQARTKYFATKEVNNRERVLVHCQKGRSRSATIVMAHMIRSNGWSVAEALQWVTSLRDQVEPNLGFIDALRELQESLSQESRTIMRARRILLIRNIVSEDLLSTANRTRTPHTPLERDTRTSADGTPFPVLTLDVIKSFFESHVGMVVGLQLKVKTKEVLLAKGDSDGDKNSVSPALSPGDSRSNSPTRDALSAGVSATSGAENNRADSNTLSETDPSGNLLQASLGEANLDSRKLTGSSRGSLSRANSGIIPQVNVVRSAQILVEFACHESVDVAGMLKKTDANRYLPICPDPSAMLFQKALSKRNAPRRRSQKEM